MKAARSRTRKLLVAVGIIAALLTVTVATLPIWFRWVLRPVLKTDGVRFESYQAIGSTRFALLGVQVEYEDARIESARLEAPLPTRWIWSRYFGFDTARPAWQGADWRLIVKTTTPGGGISQSPASTFAVLQDIEATLPWLRSWFAAVRLTNGLVEVGPERIVVPTVEWKRGRLLASVRSARFNETIELRADLSRSARYAISAKADPSGATFEGGLKLAAGSWEVEGQTLWRSNKVETTARFARQGWWPQQARLVADSVRVPADLLKLEGYEDLHGSFALNWADDRFQLDVSAQAKPKSNAADGFPPVALTLAARGDAESMVVEKLQLTGPGLQADLSDSVGITRSGKLLTDAASLKLSVDLAKLPWISMGGMLQGQVRIRPGETNSLLAAFELSGTGLSHEDLGIRQINLAGELNWPLLQIRRADAKFADASTFAGSAQVDLKSLTVSDGRWQFEGRLPRARLPDGFSYSKLQTTGQFSGPLMKPTHSGQLMLEGLSLPGFNSSNVRANWQGEKFNLSEVEAQLSAGVSTLSLSGSLRLTETKDQWSTIALQTLTFQRSEQTVYALQEPSSVSFRQAAGKDPGWEVKVTAVHWTGAQREITLAGEAEWPRRGSVQTHWQDVTLDDFADLVCLPPGNWTVANLDLIAKWDTGPMEIELSAQVDSSASDSATFSAQAALRGGSAGLNVDRLIVSSFSGAVVSMQGTLPVTLMPGPWAGWLRWDEKKPIDMQATTAPNKSFWDSVTDLTGVRLVNPELDMTIRGTLAEPEGLLRLHAEQLGWKFATNLVALPAIENLNVEADFKRDRVHLKTLTIELEGQPVRANGELPLGKSFWTDLLAKRELPDWHQATGRIEIVDARLSLFAKYLPELLSPQGRLTLDLGIQPGPKLNGELQITNAATRPLITLGHIHDIHALIKFADHDAKIEQFSGQVGGEPVSLTGGGRLVEKSGLQFDAALRGTNVPLVRAPGVLLRSDLNIQLSQKIGEPATISGEATLHDSLFLQDLKSLVPAGPTQQSQRPPYFSVEQEPFADWRLNLRINGEKFLRVRTPLFRGEISASFQLTGRMKEPVALGEARIASGRVQFPFGTLTVDQGYATLTSENPYRPHLFVIASGRTYGYATKMEVSGPAEEPKVTFTSTPPLTSEQIILMLTAGELPRDDVRFSQQQRATRLAMFLGKDFLGRLLGDEAAAERLTIRSGENVSNEGKLTYDLEYRLTDDWSVVGEYDRFNAMNAGLKWRIFSK